ncbi:MAG: hypothetical protein M5U28_54950 [Sandaracinaceae bacterium]|nr:hypothetical protein [Sandaracinaceae bacterium]
MHRANARGRGMTLLEPTAEPETLARYLRARQDEILRDWSAAVRRLPRLDALPESRLLDGVPEVLRLVTRLVEAGEPRGHGDRRPGRARRPSPPVQPAAQGGRDGARAVAELHPRAHRARPAPVHQP